MKRPTGELAHALAAEYVLGTLPGAARRRFEGWLAEDAALRAVVREWESGLTPLADRVPAVDAPARVWRAIEGRIGGEPKQRTGFWSSVAFWRTFGIMAGSLATVLLAFFLWLSQGPRGEPLFIAVLASPEQEPHVLVSMHSPDVLRIKMVKALRDRQGHDLELWVVPAEGAPRSLGVMPNEEGTQIIHITSADPRVRGAKSLAISLEPRGGSPTKQPTGPMVLSGRIVPVRKA